MARPGHPETLVDRRDDHPRFAPLWNGILHEFRNHLTVLTAVASELRSEIPPALTLPVGEAVGETERSVQSLASLLALVEASTWTVEPVIADLDDVIERAIRLAAPVVGRRVSITAKLGRRSGVKNRGSALECLIAALIIDLARPTDIQSVEVGRPCQIAVYVELSRASLAIEIESDGARPAAGSWRFLLARELAEKLDATVSSPDDVPAYVVQFR